MSSWICSPCPVCLIHKQTYDLTYTVPQSTYAKHEALSPHSHYRSLPVTVGESGFAQSWRLQVSHFTSAQSSSCTVWVQESYKARSKCHPLTHQSIEGHWLPASRKLGKPHSHVMLQWEPSSNLTSLFKGHVTLHGRFHLSVPLSPYLLNWGNIAPTWLGYHLE